MLSSPPGEKLWRWDDRPRLRAENPAPEGGGSPTYSRGRHFEKEKESKSSFLIRTHKEGMNEISIRLLTENKMSLSEWECGYFQGWMSKLFRQMGKTCVLVIWGLFPISSCLLQASCLHKECVSGSISWEDTGLVLEFAIWFLNVAVQQESTVGKRIWDDRIFGKCSSQLSSG